MRELVTVMVCPDLQEIMTSPQKVIRHLGRIHPRTFTGAAKAAV
jgi:hypothetical protein